jgi:hypothetical protein
VSWEDAARFADALGPAARRDLVRVLTSPSDVRADVIRQLHERPDGQEIADLLIFLEEWEWARLGMIEELSRAQFMRSRPSRVISTRRMVRDTLVSRFLAPGHKPAGQRPVG